MKYKRFTIKQSPTCYRSKAADRERGSRWRGKRKELIEIFEQLPDTARATMADFAKYLLAKNDDEAWERTIADSRLRPNLDAFIQTALTEGSEPLDPEKLGI